MDRQANISGYQTGMGGAMTTLEGTVERITFFNEETSFAVVKMKLASGELVTVTGELPHLYIGEKLRLTGQWVVHKEYGKQFQVQTRESEIPTTEKGIERFLASGFVKGVRAATAKKLVSRFGLSTLDVIENDPELVAEIPGISLAKAKKIAENVRAYSDIQRIIVFLQGIGIGPGYAMKIYKRYQSEAVKLVRENPYRLADEIIGIGFKKADQIAQNLGIKPDSPYRIRAALRYLMNELCNEGHIFVDEQTLIDAAVKELAVDSSPVATEIETLIVEKELIRESKEGRPILYLAPFYYCEIGVAARLAEMAQAQLKPVKIDTAKALEQFSAEHQIQLASNQREAVLKSMDNALMVITGGPGTGKTTIIKSILSLLKKAGLRVALAAPTGRAAKRLAEATGEAAQTIHRLLGFGSEKAEGGRFQHDESEPLDKDVLIVDEFSMVDLMLFYHLLKALAPGTRLIMVGDVDQLPSVGPGTVLRDLIASGQITAVRLNVIFRQSQESMIIENAHRINRGEFPQLVKSTDFFFMSEEKPENIIKLLPDLISRRIPGYLHCDPVEDIQVLAPMRRTLTGVDNLNLVLQEALNPKRPEIPELRHGAQVFRLGDKVMQIKNNYQKLVFNGDIGRIRELDPEEQRLVVGFQEVEGERLVEYEEDELDQLVLSYAISVHKSQGNEYPVVVMPVTTQHFLMLQRNLLYTAVTRAKKMVVLIGTKKAIAIAVNNNRIEERNSFLQKRLRNAFQGKSE
ncbi:MAG TPA: ATP-dependent RecD-like DNA helicase [Bacillota bacterium]|nr:ATP-dependent RecD-like DNA helicase [Bacillota bacterium]